MTVTIAALLRYPVKGLPEERLDEVALAPGRALPHDRRFALAHGAARGSLDGSAWASNGQFYTLKNEERLAQLGLSFDPGEEQLTVLRAGKPVARGKPTEPLGRSLLDQFFAAFLADAKRGTPHIVAARDGIAFTDAEPPYLSLLNLATVRDLERVARQPVDPRRFRANVWLEGLAPWAEMDWPGRGLRLGEAELRAVEPIERCVATTVNPDTAQRDLNVPRLLQGGYGHLCQGIYCLVTAPGRVAVGDRLELP